MDQVKKRPGVKRVRPDEKKGCKSFRIYPTDLDAVEGKYLKVQHWIDKKLEEEFGPPKPRSDVTVKV